MKASKKKAKSSLPRARRRRLGEFERIACIEQLFSGLTNPFVQIGIGDDAAVIRVPGKRLVWTVDSSVEDVHFKCAWLTETDIGWRSFHAALSDIAAMGATPIGALSALELPKEFDDKRLLRLVGGQAEAARSLNCPIIGGNLASSGKLAVTTTALGSASEKPLVRTGARRGDEVWLIGEIGMAAAGLACLRHPSRVRGLSAIDRCVAAWRRPVALVARGLALVSRASSAIDISDGLVGDVRHIAEASAVAVELDLDVIQELASTELRAVADRFGRSVLEWALYGGEDYALVATGPASKRPRWARRIGRVTGGNDVWGVSRGRERYRLKRGFDHFDS
jgi:thiamine-monophosphate kinase